MEKRGTTIGELIRARNSLLEALDELEDCMVGHVLLMEIQEGNEKSGKVAKTSEIIEWFMEERKK